MDGEEAARAEARQKVLERMAEIARKIDENTVWQKTNAKLHQELIALLKKQGFDTPGQLARVQPGPRYPGMQPPRPGAVEILATEFSAHLKKAFPPNYLKGLAEDLLHDLRPPRPRRRR